MMGQEIKTPKKRTVKIPLRVYMGYLLILTLVFSAVSFAKFATSGDAVDSARVASFSVSAAVGDDSKSVDFNDAATSFDTTKAVVYDINVTNSEDGKVSEVAVGYTIKISLDASVVNPNQLILKLDNTPLSPSGGNGTYTYTYTAAKPMPAGVLTNVTHKLSVTAVSQYIVDDYDDIQLSVSVSFTQIN